MRELALFPSRWHFLVGAVSVLLVGLVAITGPWTPAGLGIALLIAATVVAVLLRVPLKYSLVPAPLLLILHRDAVFRWFDLVVIAIGGLGLLATLVSRDRRAWDIKWPGVFSVLWVLIPLIGLSIVESPTTWLAAYKNQVFCAVLFLGLRRIVRQEDSHLLLWGFPLLGCAATLQLTQKLTTVGVLVALRESYRNFYTNLGWGASNYIAAVLVFTVTMTGILFALDRRLFVRAVLGVTILVQLSTFSALQSRAATIALAVFVFLLAALWRSRRSLLLLGVAIAAVTIGLGTLSGQALLERFTDPRELGSWAVRLELWNLSWARFLTRPWTGIGLGQGPFQGDLAGSEGSHNALLQYLMELGILGGVLFLAVIVAAYRLARKASPSSNPAVNRGVRVGVVAALSAIVFNSMVEPTMNGYQLSMMMVWFLAWLTLQDPAGNLTDHDAQGSRAGPL